MKPAPYALDLVRTRFDLFTGQLLADDGDSLGSTATETMALPLGLFDVAGDTRDGAAGADARHEHVHFTVGGVPDLGARGLLVDFRVRRVLELLQQHVLARSDSRISLALAMAPFMPSGPSVSTRLAPRALSSLRRSRLMVAGMVNVMG